MSDPAFKDGDASEARLIQPPSTLRSRIGPRFGRIDASAIAKAEAALKGLSAQFGQWLQDEVAKLEAARAALHAEGITRATIDRLYTHAHDLKGLGATYEYPIITRIAASLCKLLGQPETRLRAPLFLIDAHVDAIGAALRDSIKDAEGPVGRVLVEELERVGIISLRSPVSASPMARRGSIHSALIVS